MDTSSTLRSFGEVVLLHRRRLDLTQEALAEAANVHVNLVSRVERGKVNPGLSTVAALAQGLHTTGAELLRQAGI